MNVLVTGAAGFIGFHVSKYLLNEGYSVTGIDNLNDYYDVNLKKARLSQLQQIEDFSFERIDLADYENLKSVFNFISTPSLTSSPSLSGLTGSVP